MPNRSTSPLGSMTASRSRLLEPATRLSGTVVSKAGMGLLGSGVEVLDRAIQKYLAVAEGVKYGDRHDAGTATCLRHRPRPGAGDGPLLAPRLPGDHDPRPRGGDRRRTV